MSLKVTVPVAPAGMTVAVSVTEPPSATVSAELASVIVLVACTSVTVKVALLAEQTAAQAATPPAAQPTGAPAASARPAAGQRK